MRRSHALGEKRGPHRYTTGEERRLPCFVLKRPRRGRRKVCGNGSVGRRGEEGGE